MSKLLDASYHRSEYGFVRKDCKHFIEIVCLFPRDCLSYLVFKNLLKSLDCLALDDRRPSIRAPLHLLLHQITHNRSLLLAVLVIWQMCMFPYMHGDARFMPVIGIIL